jgi:hypothetical protein
MTAWINHVKEFAKSKGVSYRVALKDPQCSASYKSGKKDGKNEGKKEEKIAAEPTKEGLALKKRGRPRKYPSPEAAKEAKSEMTVKSNRKKKESKKGVEGQGIIVPNKSENTGGLGHIYPLSHEIVRQMLGISS